MAKPIRQRGKWRVRPIGPDGRRISAVFDTYQEAIHWSRQVEVDAEEIRQGLRSRPPADRTFGELCDYWLGHRAREKRSRHHDESIIRAHLRPHFGDLLLRDIGVADRDAFVKAREHLNKKTVANHLTLLLTMLNEAVELGWLVKAPRIRKPKVRMFTKDYRYLRTDEEITRFLNAARDLGELPHVLYATAVYTGMRQGELAALTWEDVDFERRLITVQRSFEGPTKAEDVRYVPILDALLPTLRDWRLRCPLPLVFPNERGNMQGPSARVFQEVLHRVLEAAGFKPSPTSERRHYIVFHDLRHSFASHWVMKGGSLFKLQKILGHKTVQMTMRYAHLVPEAYAEDYNRLGGVTTTTSRVVPIR